jgi:hypothetical protein
MDSKLNKLMSKWTKGVRCSDDRYWEWGGIPVIRGLCNGYLEVVIYDRGVGIDYWLRQLNMVLLTCLEE